MFRNILCICFKFQSTHPLRGATIGAKRLARKNLISIHAPLAGCDYLTICQLLPVSNFNPRTPCGVRPLGGDAGGILGVFQSTHPLRGATVFTPTVAPTVWKFQSTHPLRGATQQNVRLTADTQISIHAPLAGCDWACWHLNEYSRNFNPRTPCGVRRHERRMQYVRFKFQSTHPLRGATAKLPKYSRQICAKATKFLQSRTKSVVAALWAKGKRPLFPALRGANLPGKTGTLPVRIR